MTQREPAGVSSEAPAARPQSAALSRAIARGDGKALAEFYRLWFERLYARARAMTGRDESFCLDVVQETMLRVARKMRAMKEDAEVERWLARVLRSSAVDLLRKETRRGAREGRVSAGGLARSGHELAGAAEEGERLRESLAALDGDEAVLVKLRIGDGETLKSAGRALGISGDAAHGKIRRALRKLRALTREVRE